MDKPLHILIVEDLETDAKLAEREILTELPTAVFKRVETHTDFTEALESFKPDVIVSDYQMPAFDGITALEITLEKTPSTPFIMHTGSMNEDTAVECMKAGATDYVIKEHIKRLGPAVKHALKVKQVELKSLKAQQALIESENRFRRLAENADDLIYRRELYPEQKFTYISPSVKKITGFTPEDYYADPDLLYKLIHPEDRMILENMIKEIGKGPVSITLRWVKKDGEVVWTEQKNVPVFNDEGRLIATEVIARDITQSKHEEEELRIAKERAEESDRLKSAFLANMSHEIRTPMNGILGFAQLLRQPDLASDQQQKFINIIEKSGKRMLNLINDLMEISKIESGHIELNQCTTNVNKQVLYILELFTPAINDFADSKRIKTIMPDTDAYIETDPEKLNTILSNLINNAFKFSSSGLIEVGYTIEQEFLKFFVKDEGIGIPEDNFESIFNRFVQVDTSLSSSYEGAGLGLSISKAYAELLGGTIWVESKIGKGSAFFFTLPNIQPKEDENDAKTSDPSRQSNNFPKKLKVLIADDDQNSYELLCVMLEEHASEFFYASTGKEAVDMARTIQGIDVIFMDIKMPDMNGYNATRQIRTFNNEVVIIAQTAYAMSGDREKALESGCNDHITKPLGIFELQETIKKYFPQSNLDV